MRVRTLLGVVVLVMCAAGLAAFFGTAGVAQADPAAAPICGQTEGTAGTALSGTYQNLTVSGIAYVANDATLTVKGGLTLLPGSCLDAFSTGTVQVGGDVMVGFGATLALGCAPGANGPPPIPPCNMTTTDDTVGGSIFGLQPKTMYLTAVTVGGDVFSFGGGLGLPHLNFPIKDMNIAGSLTVIGWSGGPGSWIGALRNHVGGNLEILRNGNYFPDPDSMEIEGNTVGNNLDCQWNTPAAQYGDAYDPSIGNGPNTVGGTATGECASLTTPRSS